MKEIKIQGCIVALLSLVCFSMAIMTIMMIVEFIRMIGDPILISEKMDILFFVIILFDYTFLSYILIKIVNCNLNGIFSVNNVKNFKKLGYGMIVLALAEEMTNISAQTYIEFNGIAIKPAAIVFFIIGLTNIYLAHVFKEGKRIKEENDLII
ncbi:DUF2975 domain-containing protein [Clostridium senegalense]|uniref:DUF2975 domain-containing protein n=1 Tax=Clostridium senegalense TaxID=1465809 RepID=A0A6M0H870_9CLOT|nr:DUF2975 domain-containing protein [Clostridium senegalense]NEU06588.1 DUF2975 domain-containing protein [Clostridium senegalense]